MPLQIVRENIIQMEVDAIVNTANPKARIGFGFGVERQIYAAAGKEKLLEARNKIGPLETGAAAITPAFNLKARYIIHTSGPIWDERAQGKSIRDLKKCYENCLSLAIDHHCESIAFPLISTGAHRFPKKIGLDVAVNVISKFLKTQDMMVYLVVYDELSCELSEELMEEIDLFIEEHFVNKEEPSEVEDGNVTKEEVKDTLPDDREKSLDELLENVGIDFLRMLYRFMEQKNMSDVELYKKAYISKQTFSKIRNPEHVPKKKTVLILAFALELSMEETVLLLASCGYAFSPASMVDVIVQYFIEHKRYKRDELEEVLFERLGITLGNYD